MSEYEFGEDIDVRDHRSQEWTTVSFITKTKGGRVLCCDIGCYTHSEFEVEFWLFHRKPLPKLHKDDPVYVRDYEDGEWQERHFSHFDSDGELHTYINGRTSWTMSETCYWNEWRLPTAEELK